MLKIIKDNLALFNRDNAILFMALLLLTGLGITMVMSASSYYNPANPYFFFKKQIFFIFLGFLFALIAAFTPHRMFKAPILVYSLLAISFTLLLMLFVPSLAIKVKGATRWLRIFGVQFQPSEIARYVLIIYLAYSLDKKLFKYTVEEFSIGTLPHILFFSLFFLLILIEPNQSTAMILFFILLIMLFCAKVPLKHIFIITLPIIIIGVLAIFLKAYRIKRILSFLDPWKDPNGASYQTVQSLCAFAKGGFFGVGIGNSQQKLNFLPEAHTDFIFSIIGEEWGFIGVFAIIVLFLILILMGFRIALHSEDFFSTLLGLGIITNIAISVIINILVTIGLFPVTGIALPFISYGGTSLVINMVAIGILFNISGRNAKQLTIE